LVDFAISLILTQPLKRLAIRTKVPAGLRRNT
jgi:hypothetical protein